jgi:hypothetical protein
MENGAPAGKDPALYFSRIWSFVGAARYSE